MNRRERILLLMDETNVNQTKHVVGPCRGWVAYLFAFDLAHELRPFDCAKILGQEVAQFSLDTHKRRPRELLFFHPQMIHLPPLERAGPKGTAHLNRTIKFLPVGVMSISIQVPFEVPDLNTLVAYHNLEVSNASLHNEVHRLAAEVFCEIHPYCVRPVDKLEEEEAYTVFCIDAQASAFTGHDRDMPGWLCEHRREVAALLKEETDPANLSEEEAAETTRHHLSYYQHDLVVIDWDAALVVQEAPFFDEILHVLESANVQLTGLESYDRFLDGVIDRAYRDLGGRQRRTRKPILRDLREIRIDLARLNDEMSNLTKFFGDWHLARIYEQVSERFHLVDWRRIVGDKLRTLDQIYEMLKHEYFNRWMLVLEITIVLCFVLDLILIVVGMEKSR